MDEHGVYPFERYVHAYFELPGRYAYFARVDGTLAGFALVDTDFAVHKDFDHSMGEFFVMHKYRRNGVGRVMATTVFEQHKGNWEVGFHPKNTTSEKFWLRTVGDYTNGRYSITRQCPGLHYNDGSYGTVLAFNNSAL